MSQQWKNWMLFILLSLVWGSSFILMKLSTRDLTGWQIGSIRIFSAGIVSLPFAIFHIRSIPRKKLHYVILSGVLGNLFPAFLFPIAIEHRINSSLAAILNSLTPLCVIVVGLVFFKKKVEGKKIAGVLIGLAGLVLLILSKGNISWNDTGITMLIFMATLFYGFNVNMVSKYLQDVAAVKVATVSMAFIAIPAGFILWQQQVPNLFVYDEAARMSVYLVMFLGITGTAIATAIFYQLIQKAGGLFASLVTYVIPLIAMMWGLLANEEITLVQTGCLALILCGVWLAHR
jgi:drug/metabolite transporter (DMT)-like permease